MKILYAAASPIPSKAANSVHVVKMAQALATNGHDVTLMAPRLIEGDGSIPPLANIFAIYDVQENFAFLPHQVAATRHGTFLYALEVVRQFYRIRAEFIFTRCLPTALLASLCLVPVVYERHSDFWENRLQEVVYRIMAMLPRYKATIVVSHALKKYYTEQLHTPGHMVHVAPDGSDPINLSTLVDPPFKKLNGRKSLGYIGHLYRGRGIDLIAEMARKKPEYDFHIVGGNDEDIAFWHRETARIRNMYLHGFVPHARTKNFLLNFDAILAPYQKKVMVARGGNTEKWMSPLKIFESMSSGKPLICSDMPVLREVLKDGENCVLCPPDDLNAWLDALDRVLLDDDFARSLGKNALDDFLQNYTWQRRAEKIIASVFNR